MLTQNDFLSMLGDMQAHMAKTVITAESLITDTEDKDLRYKFVALKQSKLLHLETLQALSALVREHSQGTTAAEVKVEIV